MRHAMYRSSYGERERAARYFRGLPADVKRRIRHADLSKAERACPQRIPIARVMAEIREELG